MLTVATEWSDSKGRRERRGGRQKGSRNAGTALEQVYTEEEQERIFWMAVGNTRGGGHGDYGDTWEDQVSIMTLRENPDMLFSRMMPNISHWMLLEQAMVLYGPESEASVDAYDRRSLGIAITASVVGGTWEDPGY